MNSAANVMAERASQFQIDFDTGGFRQMPRNKLGVHLSNDAPFASTIQSFRKHERSQAFPDCSPIGWAKNSVEFEFEWCRQSSKDVKIAAANYGHLKISFTAFRPSSAESSDGLLGRISQAHPGVNDDVVEMAIAIEVDWDRVRVLVVVTKGLVELVLPGEFRAVHAVAIAEAADDGAMEQLGLRKCSRDGWQRRPIPTRGGEGQEHCCDCVGGCPARCSRNCDLESIAPSPVEHTPGAGRLRPAVTLPPGRVLFQAGQQISRVRRYRLCLFLLHRRGLSLPLKGPQRFLGLSLAQSFVVSR